MRAVTRLLLLEPFYTIQTQTGKTYWRGVYQPRGQLTQPSRTKCTVVIFLSIRVLNSTWSCQLKRSLHHHIHCIQHSNSLSEIVYSQLFIYCLYILSTYTASIVQSSQNITWIQYSTDHKKCIQSQCSESFSVTNFNLVNT